MATLDQYLADQATFNANVKADLDTIQQNTTALNQKIADLTAALANGATLTADQQSKVDALEQAGTDLQAQADAAAGKTPPAPPANP